MRLGLVSRLGNRFIFDNCFDRSLHKKSTFPQRLGRTFLVRQWRLSNGGFYLRSIPLVDQRFVALILVLVPAIDAKVASMNDRL